MKVEIHQYPNLAAMITNTERLRREDESPTDSGGMKRMCSRVAVSEVFVDRLAGIDRLRLLGRYIERM